VNDELIGSVSTKLQYKFTSRQVEFAARTVG